MTTDNRTREELLAEIEALRFRLEEAEETLRAIGGGEVDAFVVSGHEGEQVFTLKGAEQPYRVLVETMNEGAANLAADGTILYCNNCLANMLQIPLENLIGTYLSSHVAATDRPLFAARLEKCTQVCDREEISLISGAGQAVPVLFSCCATDLSGRQGISIVVTDISARKEAEVKMLCLNRLYTVLSQTNEAIVRCSDRDSLFQKICRVAVEHGGFRMVWIGLVNEDSGMVEPVAWSGNNEGYLDGISISVREEPEGAGPSGRAIHEGGVCIVSDFMHDSSSAPWREEAEKRGFRSSAAISLKLNGKVVGVLTMYASEVDFFTSQYVDLLEEIGMDISFALDNFDREARRREAEQALKEEIMERLRVSEQLRENEQHLIVQSRQAAMGEMINHIAHQWRQPLNNISLTVQILREVYHDGECTGEYMDETVSQLMRLIQHMSQTIEDFRNFFRPDREMRPFDLKERVEKTLVLVRDSLKANNITIDTEAEEGLFITGYPNEYCQVLLNILNNANDALTERNVASPRIEIKLFKEGNKTVATISDNAGGISEAIIDKIFDPYFTTKDDSKGTGLGLYISKTIIEKRMNGKTSVRNTDKGAEFRIEV